jgi:hypothetical protein
MNGVASAGRRTRRAHGVIVFYGAIVRHTQACQTAILPLKTAAFQCLCVGISNIFCIRLDIRPVLSNLITNIYRKIVCENGVGSGLQAHLTDYNPADSERDARWVGQ